MSLSTDYSTSSQNDLTPLDPQDIDLQHLHPDARAVLDFWFNQDNESYWFKKSDEFDNHIRAQFRSIWQAAKQGECATWRQVDETVDNNSFITSWQGDWQKFWFWINFHETSVAVRRLPLHKTVWR